MELSQPRPYGTEGRKPTHDFLSLYSHSTAQQDPRPTSQVTGYSLKTHDFLQPLERVGKACAKEEITSAEVSSAEKPPPPAPPPVEHVLPGGIGTYSISHIPYFNPIRAPKPEGTVFTAAQTSSTDRNDENSHCSSYTGSGFTLWEESAVKKGKTGKENMRDKSSVLDGAAARAGQWGSSSERPTQSSSNNHHGSFSSLSSSQPSGQRSQSFMEMIKSAKGSAAIEDEFEEEEHLVLKKEISTAATSHKELRIKVDGKSSDQKANTPRSKHSATEQRRRSKINDRFQMLRELIPHGDQKRDKASFLLEVIEYIQFLQDKVQKHEGPYQGWNNEQRKLMPWRNNNRIGESFDHSQGMNSGSGPALSFATTFEEKPLSATTTVPGTALNPVESDTSAATITNKGMSFPMSLHPNFFSSVGSSGAVPEVPSRLLSDVENTSSQPHSQLCQTRSCTTVDGAVAGDKLKKEELTIEGGTISISSAYSQGLLSTLTHALQSSGVDLSQASISVQIELKKPADSRTAASTSVTHDNKISPSNQGMKHSRAPNADVSDQAQKKLKASKN